MVNKFTPVTDLETYWSANFDHTNVTSLTADPAFTRKSEDITPTASANGVIDFKGSRMIGNHYKGDYYRNEIFAIDFDIFYEGNETTIREILGELDRLNNVNNQSSTRTYHYKLIYEWDGDVDIGKIECTIIATKFFAGVPIT